jgi:hypothetical protein
MHHLQITEARLEDDNYDYGMSADIDQSDNSSALCQIRIVAAKALETIGL